MENRLKWIDWSKTVAIFSVVLLHIHCNNTLSNIINGYVMPLFFFLSGYLFSFKNNPEVKKFFKKRFRQLIVPYLWINIVAYMGWLFVLRHYGSNEMDQIEWHTPLVGIFIGIGSWLVHDIPLWSLLSFFVVEILFYLLIRAGLKYWIVFFSSLFIFSLLEIFFPQEFIEKMPIVLGPSLCGLIFYSLGYGWRNSLYSKIKKITNWIDHPLSIFLIFLFSIFIFFISINYTGPISFYVCKVGSIPFFFIASVSGIFIMIIFSKYLNRIFPDLTLIRIISIGTLIICGFHLLVFALIKGIGLFVFNLSPDHYSQNLFIGLITTCFIMASCIPIIWFIRKYLRFLVDK